MKFINWLKRSWFDLAFISFLIWLITKVIGLIGSSNTDKADWMLVYLTAIYATISFYLAMVSLKASLAAERSAIAMEESTREIKLSRLAQFSALLMFPEGKNPYYKKSNGNYILDLINQFNRPIMNLQALIWETELGSNGDRELKFSSLLESDPLNVESNEREIKIFMRPSKRIESERIKFGEAALDRFKQVNNNLLPENSLLVILYWDLTTFGQANIFVYDCKLVDDKSVVAS